MPDAAIKERPLLYGLVFLAAIPDAAANRISLAHVEVGFEAFSAASSTACLSDSDNLIRSGRSLLR